MFLTHPHRKLNILTFDRVIVSLHCSQRPWQGKVEDLSKELKLRYDNKCYLCPNERANRNTNPANNSTFVLDNDFSVLIHDTEYWSVEESDLFVIKSKKEICKYVFH